MFVFTEAAASSSCGSLSKQHPPPSKYNLECSVPLCHCHHDLNTKAPIDLLETSNVTKDVSLKVKYAWKLVQFVIPTVFCQISFHTNTKIVKPYATSSISAVINTDVAFKAVQKQHGAQAQHVTHKAMQRAHFIGKLLKRRSS